MSDARGGKPVNLAEVLAGDRMFSHNAAGRVVTRDRKCECGRTFTQMLLSERFIAMTERQSKRALELLTKQCPDFFVPVHCPSCERVDLGHAARMAERTVYPFGDRDAAD